jgi:hypothetical protein
MIYRRHEAHRDALAELSAEIKAATSPRISGRSTAPTPCSSWRAGSWPAR